MELGKAYVQIVPSAQGIKSSLSNELGGAGAVAGKKAGIGFAALCTKAIAATGIVAAVGGILTKGWDRMTQIDNAKAKLTALGHSTESVAMIAENANKAVKGTAFGMDAAMTAAASATAAGIKPGQELTRYLSLMGDAAAVAGTSMEDMGSIFNKVAANGKISAEEMNQLADRGIPIWQLLAKETGMSMEQVRSAVSSGQIGIEELQGAIEKGMGGAAKTIGSTTLQGAISNIGASLSRIGANFLGAADDGDSFAGKLLPLMNKLMDALGKVEAGASYLGKAFGEIMGPVFDAFGDLFDEMGKGNGSMKGFKDVIDAVTPVLTRAIQNILPQLINGLKNIWAAIQPILSILAKLVVALQPVFNKMIQIQTTGLMVFGKLIGIVAKAAKAINKHLNFAGMVAKVESVWNGIKNAITHPFTTAMNTIKRIVNKIKSIVNGVRLKLNLKVPKIDMSGGKAPWGIGGKGKLPSFRVHWAAKGGIVDGATLIGAGEKGAEAIVPLDPFWKRLEEQKSEVDYDKMADAFIRALATFNPVTNIEVDGKSIAKATASHMQRELNSLTARNNRKLGYV